MIFGTLFGRRAKRKQRSYQKAQAKYAENQARRNREATAEAFEEEKQRMESTLAAVRGLGNSSIATTNREALSRARMRAMESADEGVSLARKARKAMSAAMTFNRFLEPLSFLDRLGESVGGRALGDSLFGGGDDGGAPSASTAIY